jgi:hypothetical protein
LRYKARDLSRKVLYLRDKVGRAGVRATRVSPGKAAFDEQNLDAKIVDEFGLAFAVPLG